MVFGVFNFLKKKKKFFFRLLYYDASSWLVFVTFWRKSKTPENHYEIIWPLVWWTFRSSITAVKSAWNYVFLIFKQDFWLTWWRHWRTGAVLVFWWASFTDILHKFEIWWADGGCYLIFSDPGTSSMDNVSITEDAYFTRPCNKKWYWLDKTLSSKFTGKKYFFFLWNCSLRFCHL